MGRVKNSYNKISYGNKPTDICDYRVNINYKVFLVSRLIGFTFLGNPPTSKHHINHIDENYNNNKLENLEWVTQRENCIHTFGKKVFQFDKNNNLIKTFNSISLVIEFIKKSIGWWRYNIKKNKYVCIDDYKYSYENTIIQK